MRGWFVRILLVTVLLQTTVAAIRPMVSYKAISVGADAFDLGVIAAAFAILSLFVAVPIGRWVDRWGEPWFIVAGAAVIAVVSLSLVWIDTLWALTANQAALGLGHIMTVVGTQTLIANAGDPGRRDGRFGVFTVVVSLGQLAGPAAAGLVAGSALGAPADPAGEQFGTGAVFGSAAVVSVLATLLATGALRSGESRRDRSHPMDACISVSADPAARRSSWHDVGRVLQIPSMPHAMVASLTVLTTIDLLAVYLPAYGEANGLSVETVGLLLGARAAASMASRLLMLPLIRLLGRRLLLAVSIALPAISMAIFPLLDAPTLLYTVMVVTGFGLGLGQPITLAWVADRAPADVRGTAIGVRLSGNRLGQTVLPVAVGVVAGTSGLTAVFVSLSVLLGASAAAVLSASFGQADQPGRDV